jgi:DNA-binding XRE family transcriptional regulator
LTLGGNINQISILKNWKTKSMVKNRLKETRESLLMSKAELARHANISPITISRIENGLPCRLETKRKILLALGLQPSDKHKIFKD